MKVKELIEFLQNVDGELTVYVSGDGYTYGIAEDVAVDSDNDVVICGSGQID